MADVRVEVADLRSEVAVLQEGQAVLKESLEARVDGNRMLLLELPGRRGGNSRKPV